jgi:hypothetical protein
LFEFLKNLSIPLFIRAAATQVEGQWFDATRRVHTSGYVFLDGLTLAGAGQSGFDYLPVRPAVARQAIARLPIQNHAEYRFVDLGSGKGRMLLVAAEYPFRTIHGIEFALQLHREAEQNISCYRHARQRCTDLESVNLDASEYRFPDGKLILYLYNPFGPEILRKVLTNLEESIAQQPRHVIVIMVNPEFAFVTDSMPFLHLYFQTRRFRIYQTANA